ncbi:MAG TPA: hypothetical protein VMI11_05530 [Actinomycetes bacterium]|nr:hypothetical protein [Actinomycetes bacterium]
MDVVDAEAGVAPRPARWRRVHRQRVLALDGVAVALGVLAACALQSARGGSSPALAFLVGGLSALSWWGLTAVLRAYDPRLIGSLRELAAPLAAGAGVASGLVVAVALGVSQATALLAAVSCGTAVVASLLARAAMRVHLAQSRLRGRSMSRVLVAGPEEEALRLARDLRGSPAQGLRVVAACLTEDSHFLPSSLDQEITVAGGFTDVVAAARHFAVDVVALFPCAELDAVTLGRINRGLADAEVEVLLVPSSSPPEARSGAGTARSDPERTIEMNAGTGQVVLP